MHLLLVKPYPDANLPNFMDRKKQGTKGKKIQERLESSIKGFHDAFTGNSENWVQLGKWPEVLMKRLDISRRVGATTPSGPLANE